MECRGRTVASDSGQRPTLEPSRLHELRNALMAAEAAAHGLRSGPRTLMQVTTLLDGLTDALATVRALATDVGVPVAPVSVGTFEVADVLRGQVAVALAGGVDIRLVGAVDAEVRACRRRFAQVLENLLSNARRHGRAADGRVVVDVEVTACPDLVLVSVRDRGPGVPAALATCLRRGAQPLPVPDDPHGLGLALSVRMARAMGGDLWYEVRPGGGACLLLSLPRAAGAVLDEPQQVVQVPEARHDLSLVVEDGRAVAPLGGQVVETDHHLGVDRGRARRPQRDPVPAGRRLVDDHHLDVGLEQDPQAVGQQWRTGAEGDVVGRRGVRFHAPSGPRGA